MALQVQVLWSPGGEVSLAKEPPVGRSWSCLWSLEESDRQGPLGGEGGCGELVGTDRRGKRRSRHAGREAGSEARWANVYGNRMVCS